MRIWLLVAALAAPLVAFADDDDKPLRQSVTLHRPSAAPAKPAAPPPSDDDAPPPTLNPDQPYQGVTVGNDRLPPHPPRLPTRGPQQLTWTGFQERDGVPTVFIQLTGAPDYTVAATGEHIVVTLRNTVVRLRNNRRPLRLESFDTSITHVDNAQHGRDLKITIHTRKPNAAHKESVQAGAGGYQLLLVEVPKQ